MKRFLLPAAVVLVGLVVVAGAFLVARPSSQDYLVPGESMRPTLEQGDRVTVTESDVRRGDIIPFDATSWGQGGTAPHVSRVIGVGGDVLHMTQDGLDVNGDRVEEDYLATEDDLPFEATVPAGTVFVAGDHRDNSVDSRMFVDQPDRGGIPTAAVIGTVVAVNGTELSPTGVEPVRLILAIGGGVVALAGVAGAVLVARRKIRQ